MANSGSILGSTPNSKLFPAPLPPASPGIPSISPGMATPSSAKMGLETTTSLNNLVPGGIVTKWELSPLFALSTKALKTTSFGSLDSSSPKETTSTATLFFLSFLANLTKDFSSADGERGEPTKTMMRWRRFLFVRCLRAS
jgi:hypothetical protein